MKTFLAMMMLLAGMCACGTSTVTLDDTMWKLTEMEGIPADTIHLEEDTFVIGFTGLDKTFYGRTNCNRFFGSYEQLSESVLRFNNVGVTRMACPNMEYEDLFLQMINKVSAYRLTEDQLQLLADGKIVAVFAPYTPVQAN